MRAHSLEGPKRFANSVTVPTGIVPKPMRSIQFCGVATMIVSIEQRSTFCASAKVKAMRPAVRLSSVGFILVFPKLGPSNERGEFGFADEYRLTLAIERKPLAIVGAKGVRTDVYFPLARGKPNKVKTDLRVLRSCECICNHQDILNQNPMTAYPFKRFSLKVRINYGVHRPPCFGKFAFVVILVPKKIDRIGSLCQHFVPSSVTLRQPHCRQRF